MITLDLFSEVVELAASVGLIASCILLLRFFRGGIMVQSFIFFSVGSVLFFVDRSITTLISLAYLPSVPFTVIHLIVETIFVVLFTVGFLLLYRNWMHVQHHIPERRSVSISQ